MEAYFNWTSHRCLHLPFLGEHGSRLALSVLPIGSVPPGNSSEIAHSVSQCTSNMSTERGLSGSWCLTGGFSHHWRVIKRSMGSLKNHYDPRAHLYSQEITVELSLFSFLLSLCELTGEDSGHLELLINFCMDYVALLVQVMQHFANLMFLKSFPNKYVFLPSTSYSGLTVWLFWFFAISPFYSCPVARRETA